MKNKLINLLKIDKEMQQSFCRMKINTDENTKKQRIDLKYKIRSLKTMSVYFSLIAERQPDAGYVKEAEI
jgi:hypothetical protein